MTELSWFAKANRVYLKDAVLTPPGRVSFPSLVEPRPREHQGKVLEPQFEFSILLDKEDGAVQQFEEELLQAVGDMVVLYNNNKAENLPKLGAVDNVFKDGNKANLEKYPMQEGKHVLIARNKKRPDIIDKAGNDLKPEDIKAGMIVRAFVVPHFGSTGISYRAEALQVMDDDGVRFGGSRPDYRSLMQEIQRDIATKAAANPVSEEPTAPVDTQPAEPAPKKLSMAEQARQQAQVNASTRGVTKVQKGIAAAKNLL